MCGWYMCWPSLGLTLSIFLWLLSVGLSTFWSNKWTAVNTWLRLCVDHLHLKWHFRCNQMHLVCPSFSFNPLSLFLSLQMPLLSAALHKATELRDDRSPSEATVMTTFTILLIDKNDNAPKFNSSEYRVRITELAQVGFALPLFIQVEDKDEVGWSHPDCWLAGKPLTKFPWLCWRSYVDKVAATPQCQDISLQVEIYRVNVHVTFSTTSIAASNSCRGQEIDL